jgi:signal transduction histidine kinase
MRELIRPNQSVPSGGWLRRLRRPFLQGDVGMMGRAEGTGTGLALSLRLAHSIGAELRFRSAPGLGTSVTLRLARHAQFRQGHAQAADAPAVS